ncbi:ABC transporter permease [Candidatus Sumerlaeota bacterium]|nr:ABC transporter permease [Candidatus Sumerlaeota bacterium]
MLQEILRARPLLWLLVKQEFRSRYAGSNFGALWNIIHPIVLIGIYVLIFSHLMGSRMGDQGGRMAYVVHMCSAIVPWFLFSEIISRCSTVLLENSALLKKMALPEEVLYLSVFITSFTVHGISMSALIALLALAGAPIHWFVLFAYPVMFALGITALGLGMVLSVMTLLVRDVGQVVQIVLQLLFWSLPIVYIPSIIASRKVGNLLLLNPIRGFFTLIQWLFGSPEASFQPDAYWMIVLLPFAMMLIGLNFLRKNRSEILDAL